MVAALALLALLLAVTRRRDEALEGALVLSLVIGGVYAAVEFAELVGGLGGAVVIR